MTYRKKLIEVALPLEAINAASSREKSIRHGHPSTLHLWWARRPLAACRAILFGQLVDDPSSVPEEFPDEKAQEKERRRLFKIIEDLVTWENSTNERVTYAARHEIARSVARGLGEAPPRTNAEIDRYLAEKAPPVLDPFCGGGSIPLEAQRLGLRAFASDLNPVAVLITKALIEIPPKFAGRPPVNPEARAKLAKAGTWSGKGAQGLADDVRFYGRWMRDEAEKRIGHLYPKVKLPDGSEATVIAWLWARTVASPNPAAKGAHVPLVSSFVLSSKKGKEAIVQPVVDVAKNTYRFEVKTKGISATELAATKGGTKTGRGANFRCLITGAPIPGDHIKAEGQAGRMKARLMAVVAEGARGRVYLAPTPEHEETAQEGRLTWRPEQELADDPRNIWCVQYGLTTFGDLFTLRQLVALTTFSDLVGEAREKALADARAAGLVDDGIPPNDPGSGSGAGGGAGAQAYADAVATYLAFAVNKAADRNTTLCTWEHRMSRMRNTFGRQALPMVWDYAETNPLAGAGGDIAGTAFSIFEVLNKLMAKMSGAAKNTDATKAVNGIALPLICTDPPYYDNIGYADLSDFFYVWLRRSIGRLYPDLFPTLLTPKAAELVATPYRFNGDKHKARQFFESGLRKAIEHMRIAHMPDYPMTMIYAYKQAETESDENGNGATASTGWETMLYGIVNGGFAITGTWPIRSELGHRSIASGTNALASSIVLACRPRPDDAPVATRRDFAAALKRELPAAVRQLQQENIAPVDLAQAAIGPGMAVFSRYAKVLEADGAPMPVRSALIEINRVLDETLAEQEGDMDADTRFCVAWFEQHGAAERPYGEAEVLFTAKNTSFAGLEQAGVIVGGKGKVRLKRRDEMDPAWDPRADERVTDWECVQHLVRALTAEAGGGAAEAARLAVAMGPGRAENARALAYRLYTVAERKGWTAEALACNILVTSWPHIQAEAAKLAAGGPAQGALNI